MYTVSPSSLPYQLVFPPLSHTFIFIVFSPSAANSTGPLYVLYAIPPSVTSLPFVNAPQVAPPSVLNSAVEIPLAYPFFASSLAVISTVRVLLLYHFPPSSSTLPAFTLFISGFFVSTVIFFSSFALLSALSFVSITNVYSPSERLV